MKFVQNLFASLRGKKQKTVEEVVIPAKSEPVQGAVIFIPTCTSKVSVISSEDNLNYNNEGFPVNVEEDAHFITKRMFTPSTFYVEPPFLPWSEQERVKQNKNPVVNKDLDTVTVTHNTVTEVVPAPIINQINQINEKGEISVYNGYPIEFKTVDGVKIATNNRGDFTFNTNEEYNLCTETGEIICKGYIVRVLNCDVYDKERIINEQGISLLV